MKLALKADHYRDRELFFRLTGSLPDKKGASINIFNNPTAQAATGKLADGEATGWLKTFDEEIIEMTGSWIACLRAGFRPGMVRTRTTCREP